MSELKPCPFCGGREFLVIPPSCKESDPYNPADLAVPLVRCRTAGCWAEVPGKTWDHSKKSAIEAWNRRTPSLPASAEGGETTHRHKAQASTSEEMVERLRRALQGAKVVIGMMVRPEGLGQQLNEALDHRTAAIDAALKAETSR